MCRETSRFIEFIARIRGGDEAAAADLVSRYEPMIRREVRMRLLDSRLRRVLDTADICQSILASFFVRAAAGQYDLDDPHALLKLLLGMARNKTAQAARGQYRQRRDAKRQRGFEDGEEHFDRGARTPSELVARGEILARMEELLTEEERELARLRRDGYSWMEIANQLGGTPNARRMQLDRAADRVCHELGLSDSQ